uniref:ATP synthase F0 subunit 8 n=1 Tax=Ixodes australiensis TaxID=948535 RepID=UPI001FF6376E|nr:ATP synthase F0 subunit 8 [Ixodes australiensis]UOK09738.1 ATP synthase subunit 8 [Ixodes australiensis]
MPQLFPMNWMILLMSFTMIYIMFLTIIYFYPMIFNLNFFKKKMMKFHLYKW